MTASKLMYQLFDVVAKANVISDSYVISRELFSNICNYLREIALREDLQDELREDLQHAQQLIEEVNVHCKEFFDALKGQHTK
jgi:endonuclease III-like uncharacterized protein